MPSNLDQEVRRLERATVATLRQRYGEVFGESSPPTQCRLLKLT
jgi:hypothetical protein